MGGYDVLCPHPQGRGTNAIVDMQAQSACISTIVEISYADLDNS